MQMRDVLGRIDQRLAKLGKSDAGASREATGSPDLIRNWRRAVKDGKNPGASTLTMGKLAAVLETNAPWLMENAGDEDALAAPSGLVEIPLLSTVSAGIMMRDDLIDEVKRMITVTDLDPGDWIALEVDGDSMDKISPPGSIIFVNRRDKRLVANACYVIANQYGEATYKRYRPGPPPRFEPVSVNDKHEPIFPDNEVPVIGRVKRSMIDM